MAAIDPSETVANLALRMPAAARIFEHFGINFWCRGKLSLSLACAERKLPLDAVVGALASAPELVPFALHELKATR